MGHGWVALGQHNRAAATQPVEDLRGRINGIGRKLFAGASLLITALWG